MREKDGKYYAATGSKGYRWLEAEMVKELGKEDDINRLYYDNMVMDAIDTISKYGDLEWFISDDPYVKKRKPQSLIMPCGDAKYSTCFDCPNFHNDEFDMDCNLGYDISDIILSSKNLKEEA